MLQIKYVRIHSNVNITAPNMLTGKTISRGSYYVWTVQDFNLINTINQVSSMNTVQINTEEKVNTFNLDGVWYIQSL